MLSSKKIKPIIAIVGIDGCGKTTQAKKLTNELNLNGYSAVYIRPVYLLLDLIHIPGTKISKASPRLNSKSISKTSGSKFKATIKRFFLGLFGYIYSLITYFIMKYYISRDQIIVCDRFFYQYFYDLFGEKSKLIVKLFPKPDIVFFLNTDLNVLYSRMNDSLDKCISEQYYLDVINLLRVISTKNQYIEIDSALDEDSISEIILNSVLSHKLFKE